MDSPTTGGRVLKEIRVFILGPSEACRLSLAVPDDRLSVVVYDLRAPP
jgi:hypothetical protein